MAKVDLSVILNSIRATSSNAYQTTVPLATADNIADVGSAVIKAPPAIRNEFMANLYNKIGLTLVDSPVIHNPFDFLKKGRLDYGQTIEDIYVGIAQSQPYVTGMASGETAPDPFSIVKADHYSAFYSTILSRQYQQTRHLTDLNKAFHGAGGVEAFTAALMNALISGENLDDWRVTVALLARQIEEGIKATNFKGAVHLLTDFNAAFSKTLTADDCFQDKDFLVYFSNQIKKYQRRMARPRTDLNIAGVLNLCPIERQRILVLDDISVDLETQLMPWAFNNSTLSIGTVDEIDAWYSIGADHASPPVVTPDQISVKSTFSSAETGSTQCAALIYDPNMVKIYNKERIASQQDNAKGNYWNLFMSVEDIYACSPYSNFVAFLLD